jgi:hypothetical protein
MINLDCLSPEINLHKFLNISEPRSNILFQCLPIFEKYLITNRNVSKKIYLENTPFTFGILTIFNL